jgi:hypothetical protein
MTIVLSIGLLVLAAAVVLLFAMFGELTARLPSLGAGYRDPAVSAVPDAHVGAVAGGWPEALDDVPADGDALVLVLSSACQSCEDVGTQLGELSRDDPGVRLGVVVSCGDVASGEEFIARHRLRAAWPVAVDERGTWCRASFGIASSPTALVLRDRRLLGALTFTDLAAARAAAVDLHTSEAKATVRA